MILDEFFKPNSTAVLAENNLHGGRPDDEVKFFIDSEPAYYAVMDRFGDHIEFRGEDMVAPLRLWGSIQQTAGDAGGAADIAGLEDEPMWVGDALDELDEPGVAEGTLNEEAGTMVIRKLIAEFNKQISGSPYYPLDYKDVGIGSRTRGDGARYKDPGYIFNNRDLKPEDRATWQKEKPVEKFWEFLSDKGARKIGDVSGEFGSDPHSPAVLLGKLIFVFNGRTIAWGSASRLKNSSVWRQKQPGVAEGEQQKGADYRKPKEAEYGPEYDDMVARVKKLDELSPATLASYKTKAGAAATAADSAGDRKTGDRRFSGIVKATKKQFDQDAKQSAQAVHESRLRLMASIIKTQ